MRASTGSVETPPCPREADGSETRAALSATDVSSRRTLDSPDGRNVYGRSQNDVEHERRVGRNRRRRTAERKRRRDDDHPLSAGTHSDHTVLQTAHDLVQILLRPDLLIHEEAGLEERHVSEDDDSR
jgi:hypothetical protein